MTEAELLKRDQIHDLYCGHSSWLHNWLRRKLDCSDTAADLAHDTFIKVMQKQCADTTFDITHPAAIYALLLIV